MSYLYNPHQAAALAGVVPTTIPATAASSPGGASAFTMIHNHNMMLHLQQQQRQHRQATAPAVAVPIVAAKPMVAAAYPRDPPPRPPRAPLRSANVFDALCGLAAVSELVQQQEEKEALDKQTLGSVAQPALVTDEEAEEEDSSSASSTLSSTSGGAETTGKAAAAQHTTADKPSKPARPMPSKRSASSMGSNRSRREIPSAADEDVLFFQGNRTAITSGTARYLDMVQDKKAEFGATNSRKVKGSIKRQIMKAMEDHGAQFIRQDRISKRYYLLSEKEVLEAISNSLWYACFKCKRAAKASD